MTASSAETVPATTTGSVAGMLAGVRALLLDFDGPVCRLFAGDSAPTAAGELRRAVAVSGAAVPGGAATGDGPLQVLQRVAGLDNDHLTRRVADRVRDIEIGAVGTAVPTAGAVDVLRVARSTGRLVAVVSNNSVHAVRAYLDAHDLSQYVARVLGRTDDLDLRLLKPDTHLIERALSELDLRPAAAVFVGDSVSDVQAAHRSGVPIIGYANKPGKRQVLSNAMAEAVIDTMTALADALREAPCETPLSRA